MNIEDKENKRRRRLYMCAIGIVFILIALILLVMFVLFIVKNPDDVVSALWMIILFPIILIIGILSVIFAFISPFKYCETKTFPKRSAYKTCVYCGKEYNKYLHKCPHCNANNDNVGQE